MALRVSGVSKGALIFFSEQKLIFMCSNWEVFYRLLVRTVLQKNSVMMTKLNTKYS